jgi:hypothetical protein
MWLLYFRKTLKNLACAQLREIRRNQVISAHADFNRTSKNLGSVQQRKLIRGCCSERALFWICSLSKNFDTTLLRFFATIIAIEKLLKSKGGFL